ncbi:MAG: YfcE family phosphodiesterase [Chloroflexi bacterium]|nr:YfcE family phosphodiesterase [Chloroflexota bacterium]
MTRILVIGDTHCRRWEDVHAEVRRLAAEADIVVHCGDHTGLGVVEGLRRAARKAVIVYGNSDHAEVRKEVPHQAVIEVDGKRIAVTHPSWGGPPFDPELILRDFEGPVDVVLFGHTHDPMNEVRNGVLYLNPGQPYSSFLTDATAAVLTIEDGRLEGQILLIEPWRRDSERPA